MLLGQQRLDLERGRHELVPLVDELVYRFRGVNVEDDDGAASELGIDVLRRALRDQRIDPVPPLLLSSTNV